MSRERNAVFLSLGLCALGLCALAALQANPDLQARLRARHIKETTFVSAGNRQLAGFFDDLTPDPHWDAAKLLRASRQASGCQTGRNRGMLARLASFFEGTVYAQGCSASPCNNNWSASTPAYCPTCTDGSNSGNGSNYCQGTQYDGNAGCQGDNCSTVCNIVNCTIPLCSCVLTGGACNPGDTCCGSAASCVEGTCQNVY